MSNGYLIAAGADIAAAHEISDGFGLEVIDAASLADPDTAASGFAAAANVGLLISSTAAADPHFVAILRVLAQSLQRAQLILVDADARAAFAFLPEDWPAMTLDEARARSAELVRRRDATAEAETQTGQTPAPPAPEHQPAPQAPQVETPPPRSASESEGSPASPPETPHADTNHYGAEEIESASEAEAHADPAPAQEQEQTEEMPATTPDIHAAEPVREDESITAEPTPTAEDTLAAPDDEPVPAPPSRQPPEPAPMPAAPPRVQPTPAPATLQQSTGGAASPEPPPKTRGRTSSEGAAEASAPADATAFAPKKLRRGEAELVQVTIHQPKDLKAVIKAAKKANPSAEPAPQSARIGDVRLGASIGVSLEVRGAACDGALQRRSWRGEPINFSFSVEPDGDAKKAIIIARVFIDDAQIGVIGFTRPISGPRKKPASTSDAGRLKRHKRVFLSYSSKDRETVAAIATAYQAAGVPHFWDRASLKSGEEWSPRLRKEIDRADLFHLCWSKSASSSEWVEKETEHALTRRKRSNGKNPDITVQMLDGPPWAPHPAQLDAINFDDFVRAAIVGYARGDGSN
ncbi:MAG: TIR domain-containing protein [Proteobacteria bacterium]|nr:TIR domain-containing protein [Pseudomonadota bacterium]